MARSPVIYTLPPGTVPKAPLEIIRSAEWNAAMNDIAQTFNTPQPLEYGGTNATDAVAGADNLSPFATLASAGTTNIGTSTGTNITITGTTTITALGAAQAGAKRWLTFSGVLTLTHNAVSLILPGSANIVTAAGDTALFESLGSGNWKCLNYQRAAVVPNAYAWETIASGPVSGAVVAYTNLGAYRRLRVTGFLAPATDGVNLLLQTSTNNGSSYDGAAANYYWQQLYSDNATTARVTNASATSISFTPSGVGNASDEGIQLEIIMEQFNQTFSMTLSATGMEKNAAGVLFTTQVAGQRLDTTARNAFRMFFSSGNINIGHITLEGVRG